MGRTGLGLESEAVGEGPAAGLRGLEKDGFAGSTAVWIFDGSVNFAEEGKFVEVALGVEQGGLIEWVAGMQSDGAVHRFGAGVMESGEQHIADKYLGAFGDLEDDVHLAGIARLDLLHDVDSCLLETAAQIAGEQDVAIAGQVLRREQLPRHGIQQRSQAGGIDMVISLNPHGADPYLWALFNPVGDGKGGRAVCARGRCGF